MAGLGRWWQLIPTRPSLAWCGVCARSVTGANVRGARALARGKTDRAAARRAARGRQTTRGRARARSTHGPGARGSIDRAARAGASPSRLRRRDYGGPRRAGRAVWGTKQCPPWGGSGPQQVAPSTASTRCLTLCPSGHWSTRARRADCVLIAPDACEAHTGPIWLGLEPSSVVSCQDLIVYHARAGRLTDPQRSAGGAVEAVSP